MAAELLKRHFHSEIQPLLYPSFGFLSRAINDDAFVNVNSVELPHSGTIPATTIDRSSFPATIAQRTDTPTQYILQEISTDPTHLQTVTEGKIIAYDKRRSILMQHADTIMARSANLALYGWAGGAANYIASTGSARAAGGAGQTGNRNAFAKADLLQVKTQFHKDDVIPDNSPINGVAVLTPQQYDDIIADSEFTDADRFGRPGLPQGVVDRILGFDIYIRSSVVLLNNSDVLKAEAAAAAATDQDAALFYAPNMVRRAKGSTTVFINVGVAEMYGDIMSMAQRFGASPARNDNKGTYIIYEDTNP